MEELEYNKKLFTDVKKEITKCIQTNTKIEHCFLDSMFAPFTMLRYLKKDLISLPLWVMCIAPPSSGKTLRISVFGKMKDGFALSVLTGNALMSGYRDEKDKDPSLLPLLDKKVLMIKDMTAIYTQNREARDAIIGQLRDIFDGTASKATGMTGIVNYKSIFNMLAMVTPVYDSYYSVSNVLGERFIPVRLFAKQSDTMAIEVMNNILNNTGKNMNMIQSKVRKYFNILQYPNLYDLPIEQFKQYISNITDIVCRLRTHVVRESATEAISTIPQVESNTRLAGQFVLMLSAYMITTGKYDHHSITFYLAYLSRCSIPLTRLHVLHFLCRARDELGEVHLTFKHISSHIGLSPKLLKQTLDDFRLMHILDARFNSAQRNRVEYKINEVLYEELDTLDFFIGHNWKWLQPQLIQKTEEDE